MTHSNFEPIIKSTNVRNIKMSFKILEGILKFAQLVFPTGVANFVRNKFFTPDSRPLTSQQQLWIDKAEPYTIEFETGKIQAWKIGSGPAILFAHGWNGRGAQFNAFFQPTLDMGHSIIFYDAPGHGASDGKMTNYLEMTSAFKVIIDFDFQERIVGVVAHSMGSSIVINHFDDQPNDLPLVFLAPAFPLLSLLVQSFQYHGIPRKIYVKLMNEVEEKYQVALTTRNPIDMIYQLKNDIKIFHDINDKVAPFDSSLKVSNETENVELIPTEGLGHNKLLFDNKVIHESINFIGIKNTVGVL